jgi:hypothetical protein
MRMMVMTISLWLEKVAYSNLELYQRAGEWLCWASSSKRSTYLAFSRYIGKSLTVGALLVSITKLSYLIVALLLSNPIRSYFDCGFSFCRH